MTPWKNRSFAACTCCGRRRRCRAYTWRCQALEYPFPSGRYTCAEDFRRRKCWKKEIALKSSCPLWSCSKIKIGIESPFCVVVSGQFNYTKGTASMPFKLSALLNFQGSTHLFGVGSFSYLIYSLDITACQLRADFSARCWQLFYSGRRS